MGSILSGSHAGIYSVYTLSKNGVVGLVDYCRDEPRWLMVADAVPGPLGSWLRQGPEVRHLFSGYPWRTSRAVTLLMQDRAQYRFQVVRRQPTPVLRVCEGAATEYPSIMAAARAAGMPSPKMWGLVWSGRTDCRGPDGSIWLPLPREETFLTA